MILYEAPHRLQKTLEELAEVLGEDRRISLCRELTKIHEEVRSMTLAEAAAVAPRGEYVLVIEGKSRDQVRAEARASWENLSVQEHLDMYLSRGMEEKEAMKQVAKDRGCGKREIYAAVKTQNASD